MSNFNHAKFIKRQLLDTITPYFKHKQIILITGSRQVGKTTLIQHIFSQISKNKKCIFLSFEKHTDLEIFENDIENFKKLYVDNYDVIFIDEFQYAKNVDQKLKYLYDSTGKKFIITGSSSLDSQNIGKYLVGRLYSFVLNPVSFREYLQFIDNSLFMMLPNSINFLHDPIKSASIKNQINKHFQDYLIYGGYPQVVTTPNKLERKTVLSSIVDNYLLKDIRSLLQLATDRQLLHLAKLLSFQIGNLISYTELSNSTGLSFQQVKEHLNILQSTFIIKLITPYYQNKRTEVVKNPKIYFTDLGFRNYLIDNFLPIPNRSDIGALAENYILNTQTKKVNFWRTKNQAEVDFIVNGNQSIPIEVKYKPLSSNLTITKSLSSYIDKYHPKTVYITTSDNFQIRQIKQTTIKFIPIFYF